MRIVPSLLSFVLTLILIMILSLPWGSLPPLGSFLSPQHGFWLNAEPVDKNHSADFAFNDLQADVEVCFDERLVPHVFAANETDAYYVQGYLHAKFRLWQMEFQTHVAAGRLAEVLGLGDDSAIINNDRSMRRLGMVYGARNSLKEMEKDAVTRAILDAYTAGVNRYISELPNHELPFEYRLLHYLPEQWTNLKTALFLKYMSFTLTGNDRDIEFTNAKSVLSRAAFNEMYPIAPDSLDPIVPRDAAFSPASSGVPIPASADSLYFQWRDSLALSLLHPDKGNGSNNWAVSGSKTKSGRPILSNDPHLGVNLPSLWYEMQITTPQSSTYGVSFPGAPTIIIGFNDSIAWGVTNAMRDVKDYYEVEFKDKSRSEYLFNGNWQKATIEVEEFKVKGKHSLYDTVAYTLIGPVMYDQSFNGRGRASGNKALAVRWKAHDASNELKTFYQLNRASNYQDYLNAIRDFICPAQNFVFASKSNDIAIWQQGGFPAKWHRQGDFVHPGTDSAFFWKTDIPQQENPHMLNPSRGFVSSANQLPADTSYPYYLGGYHDLYRGITINRLLSEMQDITPEDMRKMQNDNYNAFAGLAVPLLLKNIRPDLLPQPEAELLDMVARWNYRNDPSEKAVAIFNNWMDSLEVEVWADELRTVPQPIEWPDEYTLVEGLVRDSAFRFIDNIETPEKETLPVLVTRAFRKAYPFLRSRLDAGQLEWATFKDAGVRHLLRLPAFSRLHLATGGGVHVINATQQFHAPSWRMIVHLTDSVEAYGIYPGGQSGNPGSRFYDDAVADWAAGNLYRIWFMKASEQQDSRIRFRYSFNKI